ncbi:copper transport protein ctr1 [Tulasnella sp. 403]|nr:copper transport protein ctr1 [Tulasnella sp. 403]
MASDPNRDGRKQLESELATSLASLKRFRLRRLWIDFPKQGSEIGVGGYGTVYRARLQKRMFSSKIDVAVKKLHTTGDWEKRLSVSLALTRELLVWATLDHPNILPLLGFHLSVKLDEAWLVSPLAPKGNIYEFLEREHPALEQRLELAKDTAKGLEYLHTRSPAICHGDIKAVNVLIGADDHAMLCDLGLSRTENTSITTGLNAGGHPPYDDVSQEGQVIHQITNNIPPATLGPGNCPRHIQELLTKCWRQVANERPSMPNVVAELTAGIIHFFQDVSQQMSLLPTTSTATSSIDLLERELIELMASFQSYAVEPSWFTFPNVEFILGAGAWLVCPYIQNGNLSSYLFRGNPSQRALDTANGLHYLHNLKPPLNVLITNDDHAVFCDFGLARTMESMPSGLTTSTFNQGGSLPYESPEFLLGESLRTQESDVWAWGCLLQEA